MYSVPSSNPFFKLRTKSLTHVRSL